MEDDNGNNDTIIIIVITCVVSLIYGYLVAEFIKLWNG